VWWFWEFHVSVCEWGCFLGLAGFSCPVGLWDTDFLAQAMQNGLIILVKACWMSPNIHTEKQGESPSGLDRFKRQETLILHRRKQKVNITPCGAVG
jgi:hypothetical protein